MSLGKRQSDREESAPFDRGSIVIGRGGADERYRTVHGLEASGAVDVRHRRDLALLLGEDVVDLDHEGVGHSSVPPTKNGFVSQKVGRVEIRRAWYSIFDNLRLRRTSE
jgi:hypothetical protein